MRSALLRGGRKVTRHPPTGSHAPQFVNILILRYSDNCVPLVNANASARPPTITNVNMFQWTDLAPSCLTRPKLRVTLRLGD